MQCTVGQVVGPSPETSALGTSAERGEMGPECLSCVNKVTQLRGDQTHCNLALREGSLSGKQSQAWYDCWER